MTEPDTSIRRLIHRRSVPRELERALPLDLHPVLRRVFASRQVSPAELDVSLAAMIPVGRLPGAGEAAELLAEARQQQDPVMVLGDFDADGATATALMMTCLRGFGFNHVSYLVPDRFRYGYGLSPEIAELAAQQKPALIVTVDNGISSREGVERCRRLGIKVIVTDHHLPGSELPRAQIIVNPNLPDSGFPSKNLCGVGVAFYVAAALGRRLADQGLIDAGEARQVCADCLDLVALGTVADLVALDRNNRVLIAQGLRRIRAGRVRPGIQALFDCAGRQTADVSTGDLAFAIAPRLNAAGRLTHMSLGIDCLLAGEAQQAARLARRLDQLNAERRELQTRMQDQAERHLEALEDWMTGLRPGGYCLYNADWHQGIVGLVASRIRERVNGPVIAFAPGDNGMLKGSARSINGINVRDVIAAISIKQPGLVEKFGGHAMAAGITLAQERLESFREAFDEEISRYSEEIGRPDITWTDGGLSSEDFSLDLAELIRRSGPWGQGFPEPVFDNQFEIVDQRVVGGHHLKLELRPLSGRETVDAIAFNQEELPTPSTDVCPTLIYRLDVNIFRQQRSHQLVVEHIQYD